MSKWTEQTEELAKLCIDEHYQVSVDVQVMSKVIEAALDGIRELREQRDKANAKAEQYERDWYDAKLYAALLCKAFGRDSGIVHDILKLKPEGV